MIQPVSIRTYILHGYREGVRQLTACYLHDVQKVVAYAQYVAFLYGRGNGVSVIVYSTVAASGVY